MTENPFGGSTRDPIALLEHLIAQVGGLNGRMSNLEQGMESLSGRMSNLEQGLAEVKQDLGEVKQQVTKVDARLERVEKEMVGLRTDTSRFMTSLSREQTNLRAGVEDAIERKGLAVKFEMQDRFADIEKRLAELEDAERRRKEGMGA